MFFTKYTELRPIKAYLKTTFDINLRLSKRLKNSTHFSIPKEDLHKVFENKEALEALGFRLFFYGECSPQGEIVNPSSVRIVL